VQVPGHSHEHLPGRCRTCWRVCRHRLAPGQTRCDECAFALAEHPSATVRRALAQEPDLPQEVAELLATDFDATVAGAATERLDRIRAAAGHPDPDVDPDHHEPGHHEQEPEEPQVKAYGSASVPAPEEQDPEAEPVLAEVIYRPLSDFVAQMNTVHPWYRSPSYAT